MANADLPPAIRQTVLFPTIGGGRVELLGMSCLRVADWDNKTRHVHASWLPAALDILLDSRADEGAATIELGVKVEPERRDFQGDSFGLALAVADKLARFGRAQLGREILATGALAKSGRGRLNPVSGFDGKTQGVLDHVVAHNLRGAIYLFAAGNLADLSEETRALLEATCQETDLECLPITHLSEASALWSAPAARAVAPAPAVPRRRNWLRPAAISAGLLAATLAFATGAYWLWPREAAVSASASADDCMDASGTVAVGPAEVRNTQSQGEFGLDVHLNGRMPVYAIGENVTVRASVDRAAYLRVLNLDRNGKAWLIYPNRYQKDALLAPGEAVTIALRAAAPAGANLLKVIATAARMNEGLGPGMAQSPNPEYLLPAGRWQEKAVCLKITP